MSVFFIAHNYSVFFGPEKPSFNVAPLVGLGVGVMLKPLLETVPFVGVGVGVTTGLEGGVEELFVLLFSGMTFSSIFFLYFIPIDTDKLDASSKISIRVLFRIEESAVVNSFAL